MDSDSALANILEILVPVIALAVLATPVVISGLKGRWWMGLVGLLGFVGGFVIMFGAFGVPEPSEEFQESAVFGVVNWALNIAFIGGLILLIYGAARSPRPGSWWDRNRGADPTRG